MCAMVDVLPSKVPPIDLEDLFLIFDPKSQLLPPDLHTVSGLNGLIEGLAPKTPAKLSFPNSPVAEDN